MCGFRSTSLQLSFGPIKKILTKYCEQTIITKLPNLISLMTAGKEKCTGCFKTCWRMFKGNFLLNTPNENTAFAVY
jgi:hypothetical protein